MNQPIESEYGFLMNPPDAKEGDECAYKSESTWCTCTKHKGGVCSSHRQEDVIRRRRIIPLDDPDWELVGLGEISNLFAKHDTKEWQYTSDGLRWFPYYLGLNSTVEILAIRRRKVREESLRKEGDDIATGTFPGSINAAEGTKAAIISHQPTWQKVSPDNLPEAGRAFWVHRQGTDDIADVIAAQSDSKPLQWFNNRPSITHWMYCEGSYQIPPPPAVEVKEDDGFEAWKELTTLKYHTCALDDAVRDYIKWLASREALKQKEKE